MAHLSQPLPITGGSVATLSVFLSEVNLIKLMLMKAVLGFCGHRYQCSSRSVGKLLRMYTDNCARFRTMTLYTKVRQRRASLIEEEDVAALERRATVNGFEAERRRQGPVRLAQGTTTLSHSDES